MNKTKPSTMKSTIFYVLLILGPLILIQQAYAADVCCMIIYNPGSGIVNGQFQSGATITLKYLLPEATCNSIGNTLDTTVLGNLYTCGMQLPCNDPNSCRIVYAFGHYNNYYNITGQCNATCDFCPSGYSDCNNKSVDGCELYTGGTDNNNCGACGAVCTTGTCVNGVCGNGCGNNQVSDTESCDGTNLDYKNCTSFISPGGQSYNGGNLVCNGDCSFNFNSCTYCGNNKTEINLGERCDNGTALNGQVYTPGYALNGTYCDSKCHIVNVTGPYCGDHIYQPTNENNETCFRDWIQGWYTDDAAWSLGKDSHAGWLAVNGSNTYVMYSDSFDLKANTNYNLSAIFSITSGKSITVSLDTNCTNSLVVVTNCNLGTVSISSTAGTASVYKVFNVTNNSNSINGLYFSNIRLKITTSAAASAINSYVSNISIKELLNSEISYLNPTDKSLLTSGCCPSTFCWNGEYCVNSSLWTNNASYGAVWNNLLESNWNNGHVNSSVLKQGNGYRCVLNASGVAVWIPSYIKYDWNFEKSGYCSDNNACFAGTRAVYPEDLSKLSRGCVPNGKFVDDNFKLDSGNHYCYYGNWTTKSYIVATFLQNISQGKPYILQCYDNSSIVYNTLRLGSKTDDSLITAACVIIQQDLSNKAEQVITGVVPINEADGADNFMSEMINEYANIYPERTTQLTQMYLLPECRVLPRIVNANGVQTNFTQCADVTDLKVYYENNYNYFIVSNTPVSGLIRSTLWTKIVDFFKQLFSNNNKIVDTSIYNSVIYTTSYDRIYLMQNGTINVTGIEESKYDENEQQIVNVLYVNYVGSNQQNNPINDVGIYNALNASLPVGSILRMNYTATDTNQSIIIKTSNRTGLWPYLTAVLRNRPDGYYVP